MTDKKREELDAITRALVDKGLLIEAGWVSFRTMVVPKDAGADQVRDTRSAFFAGAQHLFSSIMSVLEPGDDPSPTDLARMDNISNELNAYYVEMKAKLAGTKRTMQ